MGKVGLIGGALLSFGIAATAWGLNTGHERRIGSVTLSPFEVVHGILSSLGLVAFLFGVVLIVIGSVDSKNESEKSLLSVSWGRGRTLFLGMTFLVYLAFQGPEILAFALNKDRTWTSTFHDIVNGTMLGLLLIWQIRDYRLRSTKI